MNRPPFEQRVEKIKQYLEERDLQAFVVLDDLNTIYASGFHIDVATWERPVATIIPLDAELSYSCHHIPPLNNGKLSRFLNYRRYGYCIWILLVRFSIHQP